MMENPEIQPRPVRFSRQHRRLRLRRRGRRALIRSVYLLPSMATLGNAICGFAAIYVVSLDRINADAWTQWLAQRQYFAAVTLIFLAMIFDALDGRLARFARHTTDFGGQLDSLSDMVSFGVAPAFVALQLLKNQAEFLQTAPTIVTRLIWAVGALYMSCAAIRLARFNVSNKHGEQHHFSFLGLPSPGAAGAVAAIVLLHQDLLSMQHAGSARLALCVLPLMLLSAGLLMVSTVRYPHVVNRYLRGKGPMGRLILLLGLVLLLWVAHVYVVIASLICYALWGPILWIIGRMKRQTPIPA